MQTKSLFDAMGEKSTFTFYHLEKRFPKYRVSVFMNESYAVIWRSRCETYSVSRKGGSSVTKLGVTENKFASFCFSSNTPLLYSFLLDRLHVEIVKFSRQVLKINCLLNSMEGNLSFIWEERVSILLQSFNAFSHIFLQRHVNNGCFQSLLH